MKTPNIGTRLVIEFPSFRLYSYFSWRDQCNFCYTAHESIYKKYTPSLLQLIGDTIKPTSGRLDQWPIHGKRHLNRTLIIKVKAQGLTLTPLTQNMEVGDHGSALRTIKGPKGPFIIQSVPKGSLDSQHKSANFLFAHDRKFSGAQLLRVR